MNDKKRREKNIFSYFKEQKSTLLIAVLAIIGLALLILPEKAEVSPNNSGADRMKEYEQQIEQKICELCCDIRGISNVRVSVYFDSGFESVYAYNEESKSTTNGVNSEKKYVTVGSGNDEAMVCLYEKMPHICGVAIVCKGGGNAVAANEIINLISSAFDVPKNKIYVVEGNN